MDYSVFSRNNNDATKEPMFFGQPVNVARYDQQRYPIFEKLIEKQLSFFWRPEEIDVSKDRMDFNKLSDSEKHIFLSNLKYQTLLDSIQGRSPNVVLLPLVSIPELETWIETWAFFECLAEGTEVLTQDGWKDLSETTTDDQTLVYDLNTSHTWFENPKRVVEYDYEGEMIHFCSSNPKQFQQLVTPNHRMPVIHRKSKKHHNQISKFVYADDLDYKAHHLAPISGYTQSNGERESTLSSLDKLRIAIQADGHIPKRYTGSHVGTVPVIFEFSKPTKITRLLKLLELLEITYTQYTVPTPVDKPNVLIKTGFRINLPIEYLTSDLKKLDSWVALTDKSYNWCLMFLDELSRWDSSIKDTTRDGLSFEYITTDKSNADVVQAVTTMCGYTARHIVRSDDRKESYKDVHTVYITNRSTKDGQSINKERVPYKGKVRCLEVSTGAFLIRYNGVVSVTGNTIHSRSYTHIIRNILNDPSEVFDDIVVNKEILKRAEDIAVYYDDLYHASQKYAVLGAQSGYTLRDLKKKLYLCMVAVNVLEGIRFYVSFACSFAFAERKLMEGNAKIIKLIARDEAVHLTSTQHIINIFTKGQDDPEMQDIHYECFTEAFEIFQKAAEQEKEWAKYLFKDGSIIGLNENILCSYIEYVTNERSRAVGLPEIFKGKTTNPIPWISNWLSSDNVQVAPQETEISSYLVGQIDSNLGDDAFDDFEL